MWIALAMTSPFPRLGRAWCSRRMGSSVHSHGQIGRKGHRKSANGQAVALRGPGPHRRSRRLKQSRKSCGAYSRSTVTCVRPEKPRACAAARVTSTMRPRTNGPRSLTVTTTERPLRRLVTRSSDARRSSPLDRAARRWRCAPRCPWNRPTQSQSRPEPSCPPAARGEQRRRPNKSMQISNELSRIIATATAAGSV
jgi:hypothetical protein